MPAVIEVVGGLVILVGALLGVDWFMAGRGRGRRVAVRATEQNSDNADVAYGTIETQGHSGQYQSPP